MGYQWVDDGIDDGAQRALGSAERFEIGDSNYGMQRHDMGAAQLRQLRARVGQNIQNRFAPHQPATKNVPSQYRDSGQLGIVLTKTITLSSPSASNWQNAQLTGNTTVYTSFKPNRAVVYEKLIVTFGATSDTVATTVVAAVADASDLLLTGGFSGSLNVFPNAPSASTGINCSALQASAFGVGISWPTINAGIPVTVNMELESSALFRATPPTNASVVDITQIIAVVNFALFGPQLR